MKERKGEVGGRPTVEDRLITAMEQVREIKRGKLKAARVDKVPVANARDAKAAAPPEYSRAQIIALRKRLRCSQTVFAQLVGVSAAAERSWELGTNPPSGPVRRLFEILEKRPSLAVEMIRSSRRAPAPKRNRPERRHGERRMTTRRTFEMVR